MSRDKARRGTKARLHLRWHRTANREQTGCESSPGAGCLFLRGSKSDTSLHEKNKLIQTSARGRGRRRRKMRLEEELTHLLLSLVLRLAAFFSFPPRLYLMRRMVKRWTWQHASYSRTHLASLACLLKPFCGKSEPRPPFPWPLPSSLLPPRPAAPPLLGPSLSASKFPSAWNTSRRSIVVIITAAAPTLYPAALAVLSPLRHAVHRVPLRLLLLLQLLGLNLPCRQSALQCSISTNEAVARIIIDNAALIATRAKTALCCSENVDGQLASLPNVFCCRCFFRSSCWAAPLLSASSLPLTCGIVYMKTGTLMQ